ncbi:hypothetical protein QJS10_CPB15g01117 [Acorus calamus]|uniref:RecX first three-helical domain-containing protein n=1 Tax=Acorus calamus TaxID=4465 RepID=A0AAV9D8S8_ACOCL|nr:hypothetical protein QJS10_CPB15g01117 [Acorus calamus]
MLAENLCRQISQEFLSYGRLHIVSWALKRAISTTSCRNGWDRINGYQNIGTYFVNRRLIHSSPLKAKLKDMCKPVTEFHKFDSVEKHELEAAKWKPCEEELQGFHDEGTEIAKDVWKTKEEVEQLAIEILAARAYTTAELRKKLRSKNKYPADIISSVVTDLQNRGMLNDDLYAEIFSKSRWLSRSWGPKRIKQVSGIWAIAYLSHLA